MKENLFTHFKSAPKHSRMTCVYLSFCQLLLVLWLHLFKLQHIVLINLFQLAKHIEEFVKFSGGQLQVLSKYYLGDLILSYNSILLLIVDFAARARTPHGLYAVEIFFQ